MIVITLLFVGTISSAQEIDSATVRKINKYHFGGVYKSAVSLNLGGVTGFAGFTYDYFMSQHWRFEAGLGYYSTGFGFDFYPWPIKREQSRFKLNVRNSIFSPFVDNVLLHSFGVGMTKFFTNKLNLGFDVGITYTYQVDTWQSYDWVQDDSKGAWLLYPHFNIKLGYRFSVKAWKRKRELDRVHND